MRGIKINVNCTYNEDGAWCANSKVKRSLLGLGARVCVKFRDITKNCEHCEKRNSKRPSPPPPLNVSKE